VRLPAVLMRGGAARGLFLHAHDLPAQPRARDALLLRAAGGPDPRGRHLDGVGCAGEPTRVVVLARSQRPGVDVDVLCGAIAPGTTVIDWNAPLGSLAAAAGAFAIAERVYPAGDGLARVRMRHLPEGTRIDAFVPVRGGEVIEEGGFVEDDVPFASAEIRLEVLEPVDEPFPTGETRETLEVPGVGAFDATLVSVGAPIVFVRADAFGLSGRESPEEVARRRRLPERLDALRALAARRLGLTEGGAAPAVCWVAKPASYRGGGVDVPADAIDLLARLAPAGDGRGADGHAVSVAIAVAAAVPGTVVAEVARTLPGVATRIGHAGGTVAVGAEVSRRGGPQGAERWRVDRCVLSRGARRLMSGTLHVPQPPRG
jgi:2-methylaconitate cis-trans-isomerase PrpF